MPVLQVRDTVFSLAFLTKELRHTIKGEGADIQKMAITLLQELQNRELIRDEANKRGISVSEIEVKQASAARVKEFYNISDSSPQLLQAMLKELGLDEESFLQRVRSDLNQEKLLKDFMRQIPDAAPHIRVQVILLGSPGKAEAVRERLKRGETFQALVKKMSIDIPSARNNGDLGWWPRGVWQYPSIGMIRAEGILCQTRKEANLIREKIMTGTNLSTLARQYSRDKVSRETNGYLGWIPIDYKSGKQFAAESFTLEPGSLSSPIDTREGFWIIRVLEKSPGGNAFDDVVFDQPVGWVSPPLYMDKGCYLIRIVDKEESWPLNQGHRRILAHRTMDQYLLKLAKKGSEEGWIKWHLGSETLGLMVERLSHYRSNTH
jgi:parvulin-like peptidyl-prolyl isomerase